MTPPATDIEVSTADDEGTYFFVKPSKAKTGHRVKKLGPWIGLVFLLIVGGVAMLVSRAHASSHKKIMAGAMIEQDLQPARKLNVLDGSDPAVTKAQAAIRTKYGSDANLTSGTVKCQGTMATSLCLRQFNYAVPLASLSGGYVLHKTMQSEFPGAVISTITSNITTKTYQNGLAASPYVFNKDFDVMFKISRVGLSCSATATEAGLLKEAKCYLGLNDPDVLPASLAAYPVVTEKFPNAHISSVHMHCMQIRDDCQFQLELDIPDSSLPYSAKIFQNIKAKHPDTDTIAVTSTAIFDGKAFDEVFQIVPKSMKYSNEFGIGFWSHGTPCSGRVDLKGNLHGLQCMMQSSSK